MEFRVVKNSPALRYEKRDNELNSHYSISPARYSAFRQSGIFFLTLDNRLSF